MTRRCHMRKPNRPGPGAISSNARRPRGTPRASRRWRPTTGIATGCAAPSHLFLQEVGPEAPILEVGCNIGSQLVCLQNGGFGNFYGVELRRSATVTSREKCRDLPIVQASGHLMPFPDEPL